MTIEITFGGDSITLFGHLPYGACAAMLAFLGDHACALYRSASGQAIAWVEREGLVARWR